MTAGKYSRFITSPFFFILYLFLTFFISRAVSYLLSMPALFITTAFLSIISLSFLSHLQWHVSRYNRRGINERLA